MDAVDWLVAHALYLAALAAVFLAGCGLGYYTAAKDQEEAE